MSVYLDANIVVAAAVAQSSTARVKAFVSAHVGNLRSSQFALAESVSAIGRLVRMGGLTKAAGDGAAAFVDGWAASFVKLEELNRNDISAAKATMLDFHLGLRAPDAIHLAIADRLGAELATFDVRMAKAARSLGIKVAKI